MSDSESDGGIDSEMTPREALLARHKKELKEQHAKNMAIKKAAPKNNKAAKKAAEQKVQEAEDELKARHAKELAELDAAEAAAKSSSGVNATSAPPGSGSGGHQAPGTATASHDGDADGEGAGQQHHKPSKAQRRRQQRQQQDADREARIAEEKAAMGESERDREEAALCDKLRGLGLVVREVVPDGHCMYRAIEQQLVLSDVTTGGGAPTPSFQELRVRAAAHMRQHKDEFLPFFHPLETTSSGAGAGGGAFGGDGEGEGSLEERFERHCQAVESTAEWGGQMELRALAQALRRAVYVHMADMEDPRCM
eukprot:jgi/Mesvir1/12784/Mv22837-RA.1